MNPVAPVNNIVETVIFLLIMFQYIRYSPFFSSSRKELIEAGKLLSGENLIPYLFIVIFNINFLLYFPR